jgi:membrane-associated phospholipid phosphatase
VALGPLAPIDRLTLAYLAVALGFTIARGPRTLPLAVLLPCALVLTALVATILAPPARRSGPLGQLLAEIYPLLLTPALYTHVGLVNAASSVGHDALVQRWEQALFGAQVSLAWIRAFPSPCWSALMHAAYLSFYPILAAAPLGLWFSGRRRASRAAAFAMMSTFYACYTVFFCFPVAGPRYSFAMAENAATAVPLAVFSRRLLESGSAWGTAFPSSHVAAALVAAVCAWRGWRPLGAVLLVAASLLTLGTVYCQFHYAIDALAGVVVAVLVLSVLREPRADARAREE